MDIRSTLILRSMIIMASSIHSFNPKSNINTSCPVIISLIICCLISCSVISWYLTLSSRYQKWTFDRLCWPDIKTWWRKKGKNTELTRWHLTQLWSCCHLRLEENVHSIELIIIWTMEICKTQNRYLYFKAYHYNLIVLVLSLSVYVYCQALCPFFHMFQKDLPIISLISILYLTVPCSYPCFQ